MDKKHLLNVIIILLICIIAYANSFGNAFVYDDKLVIIKNPYIKDLKNVGNLFFREYFPGGAGFNYYRPLTSILNAFDYSVWGLNPFGYHLTNFILHFISGCLVYIVLVYFFKSALAALLLSAVFVCHPAATEAITYMPSRAEPLVFIFLIISFLFFDQWQKNRQTPRRFYIYSVGAFVLACLSKETAVMLPIFLAAYCLTESKNKHFVRTRHLGALIPYGIISGLYLFARYLILRGSGGMFFDTNAMSISPLTRLISAPVIMLRYCKVFFVPSTFILEQPTVLYNHILNPAALFSWVILLIVIFAVIKFRNHKWIIGAVWFLAFIFPVSGILSINNFFYRHWLYIPSLGIMIMLADGPIRFKRLLFIWAVVMIAISIPITIKQNRHFKDELTLYREIINKFPKAERVHYNLGITYLDKGQIDDAIAELKEAIRLRPDYIEAYLNLEYAYRQKGLIDSPESDKFFYEAERMLKDAISKKPNLYTPYWYLANLYQDKGYIHEAIMFYKRAIDLKPLNPDIHFDIGRAYDKAGETASAISAYENAIKLDPAYAAAYLNLGSIFAQAGRFEKAGETWKRGLKAEPDNADLRENLERLEKLPRK